MRSSVDVSQPRLNHRRLISLNLLSTPIPGQTLTPEWFDALSVEDVDAIVSRMVSDTNWSGMRRQVDVDLLVDIRREAASLSCPTLVISSLYDHMVPPAHGRELTRLISGARHVEIASGHPAPMENPSQLLDVIEPFLRAMPIS